MKSLLELIPYLKQRKNKLITGFVFIIITISLQALYPLVIGDAIDELTRGTNIKSMLFYALKGVGLVFFSGIFLFLTRQMIIVASRDIENDLRRDFFAHLQFLSKSFYNTISTGDIMAHATNDISSVRNFLGPGIMYSFQTVTRMTVTLYILFSINVEITFYALVPLPLISYFVYRVGRFMYGRSLKVQEAFSKLTTVVQENFSGIRVIKSYVREKYEIGKFEEISGEYQKRNLSLSRVQAFTFPMMFLLTGLSIIIVIYFGGLKVISGQLTLGNIASFIIYLGQLTFPMIAFGWIVNLVQRAAPSMHRIMKIINMKPEISDNDNTDNSISVNSIKGNIEFRNVSFKYGGSDSYILKDINLNIPQGTTLGVIGHTGVGKSTFVNLLPRMFDATEGRILIDGKDSKLIPLNVLRESIGIVPQESFLFSSTVGENISYSDSNGSADKQEKILESSKIAGLYKDVESFPHGFDTIIGERGITLSGGQKQRTSLARAIYKNPKILILDDSLSAVDTHTEDEILKGLKEVMQNRTSIIISHRISTIQNCDNIIVIENAGIAEQGTHEELLAKDGIYNDIYFKQLLEEEIREME